MDELLLYLQSDSYDEIKLEQILNNKIIITKNHIKNINLDNYDTIRDKNWDFNILNLFEKYGYIFTYDDYILLVNKNDCILEYVPENMKTDEICEIAIKQSGSAFNFIPKNKKTDKLYKIAVQSNGLALQHIPKNKKTYEI